MAKFLDIIKKLNVSLMKLFYVAPLIIFALWLLQIVYFPHFSYFAGIKSRLSVPIPDYAKDKLMLKSILKQSEPVSYGHFHIADEYITRLIHQLESNPPFCMICHGTYSHSKDKKTRALTNMHAGFMECEVCHIRKDPQDKHYYFTWADLNTGKTSMEAEGGYGKYQAVIIPVKVVNGIEKRLDRIISEKFPDYKEFTPDVSDDVKKRIHEHLSAKPVLCLDCHKKDGYMDFVQLGFSQHRANQLSLSEVSRMIDQYETFHMPKMLRPE